jgi:hypothetical protein
MIATTLTGGLGNQMFMYAMVRAMSLRNRVPMAFNTHLGFETDSVYHRKLELNHFNLNLPFSSFSTFDYPMGRWVRKISRNIGCHLLNPKCKFVRDSVECFHNELLDTSIHDIYLEGYWQSEKYFFDCRETIQNDFQIVTPMSDSVIKELDVINRFGENTVMIGIRRYQECLNNKQVPGGILTKDYYNKAIEMIKSKVDYPVFVVFCQDYEWAKNNISIEDAETYFVKPKFGELASIEDLFLMTHLKHYIISNSSFYWWGAWLSDYVGKIVIAPTNFTNPHAVCCGWISLSNDN